MGTITVNRSVPNVTGPILMVTVDNSSEWVIVSLQIGSQRNEDVLA